MLLAPSSCHATAPSSRPWRVAGVVILALLAACSNSRNPAPFTVRGSPPVLGPGDDLPGLEIAIQSVTGGTAANGAFRSGDFMSVRYSLTLGDGTLLDASHLTRGALMVSGPTFNYQRVIASQSDLAARSVSNPDGTYTYTFAVPLPESYLAPLNDSPALTDGELTGQPLLAGTYTVGIEARVDYQIEAETFRDAGNATADFLFGSATTLQPRQVVTLENCNQCHVELRAHGSNRNRIDNCLLCHTAGAEDPNKPNVAGGTPGVTIEFQAMIHRIHAGATLPSVVGVTTKPDGSRDYTVASKPYQIVGFGDQVHDYSHVRMPLWPSLASPMPRDSGYDALSADAKARENLVRSGPVDCAKCHGDPDGNGPLPAPADGDLIWRQPTRRNCTSCHDDWIPEHVYTANMQTMPPQRDDAACTQCHRVTGSHLDVMDAHVHPLVNSALAPGLRFTVTPPAANLHPGDKLKVTFRVTDDAGAPVPLDRVGRIEVGVTGPTTNPNLLLSAAIPLAAITGSGPEYTTALPERVYLERVGTSLPGQETFATARSPHWNTNGALTEVYLRTVTAGGSTLAAAAPERQNFIDVAPGTGGRFARNDYIVIESGVAGQEEFLRVQYAEGDRLWFSSPRNPAYPLALTRSHPAQSAVQPVTVTQVPAANFRVHPSGKIDEVSEFGTGDVLVTYSTDFVIPARYPGTFNDSPDLDQSWGDWVGLPLLSGTYTVGMWGTRSFTVTAFGQTTSYSEGSRSTGGALAEFLVGDATTRVRFDRIASSDTCNACHADLQFHGGNRRGYEVCLMCHGTSGTEDRAQHFAGNAPATRGESVEFRQMLHKIHAGKLLTRPYDVVGHGSAAWPNNYSVHNYNEIGFPALPGSVANCASCHGEGNTAWHAPKERVHPQQTLSARTWFAACITCHDSNAARAHADANTSPTGAEACAVCHGPGEEQHVVLEHKSR